MLHEATVEMLTLCVCFVFIMSSSNDNFSLWSGVNTNKSKVHVMWQLRGKQEANKQASQPKNREIFMYDLVCVADHLDKHLPHS